MIVSADISKLYQSPFPSKRTGAIFNAFSYPTKISAEAEAIFIACHSDIDDIILDPFGGSGTTGIANKLAAAPTPEMITLASQLGLQPKWGPRKAYIYELSKIGSLVGDVLCNTDPEKFEIAVKELLSRTKEKASELYKIIDNNGNASIIRHIIWTDVLQCPKCNKEITYAESCVQTNPVSISEISTCPYCNHSFKVVDDSHVYHTYHDEILKTDVTTRKRIPYKIYGITQSDKWSRTCSKEDIKYIQDLINKISIKDFPVKKLFWGELYRAGYHKGITHLHQFYTRRNAYFLNLLWEEIKSFPKSIQDALKVFVLSYNTSHATLMTRVVAKKSSRDFVLTGAQTGVLYISNLPVEKNIYLGLTRKVKTFINALKQTFNSVSESIFIHGSSTKIELPDKSVNYIFTDPPFGDFIPYSEINQLNELWLGEITDKKEEVIINESQKKDIIIYENLMNNVFSEISRVITDNGWCTVVFHSAKAEIWHALIRVFKNQSLFAYKAAILDKIQSSFKQTNSTVTVKGDPLILLTKIKDTSLPKYNDSHEVLDIVIQSVPMGSNPKETATKRYSEYIRICIENNIPIKLNANSKELYVSDLKV